MLSKGSELIRLVPPADADLAGTLSRTDLPALNLKGMNYFGLFNFVAVVMQQVLDDLRSNGLISRVLDSYENGPWVDKVPHAFVTTISKSDVSDAPRIAECWLEKAGFNRFDYEFFNDHLSGIAAQLILFCKSAEEAQEAVFFRQLF